MRWQTSKGAAGSRESSQPFASSTLQGSRRPSVRADGEAHERDGPLGGRWREGETPREDEAHGGLGLASGLNNRAQDTDIRREQSPEVARQARSAASLMAWSGWQVPW
jgi:hypothetical protein